MWKKRKKTYTEFYVIVTNGKSKIFMKSQGSFHSFFRVIDTDRKLTTSFIACRQLQKLKPKILVPNNCQKINFWEFTNSSQGLSFPNLHSKDWQRDFLENYTINFPYSMWAIQIWKKRQANFRGPNCRSWLAAKDNYYGIMVRIPLWLSSCLISLLLFFW